MSTHIFSILCENEPGVMMRISRAFNRRQVNMDSITVGMEPSGNARIIILFKSDERMAEFIRKVIERLTQVIEVEVLRGETSVVREIALIKTKPLQGKEKEETLLRIEEIGGRVLEVKKDAIIAEVHGDHDRIERILNELGDEVLEEVARSGQVYMSKKFNH
ncbi:MAG: acetolactate synthase small subunit [Candidatus Hadarchaeota archaeon]